MAHCEHHKSCTILAIHTNILLAMCFPLLMHITGLVQCVGHQDVRTYTFLLNIIDFLINDLCRLTQMRSALGVVMSLVSIMGTIIARSQDYLGT